MHQGVHVAEIDFPGLTRKRNVEEMFKGYRAWMRREEREVENLELQVSPTEGTVPLGRTAFRMLVEHFDENPEKQEEFC